MKAVKMILQTVKPGAAPPEEAMEAVLCRGILLAFADAGLQTERQVRAALARLEKR